MKIGKGRELLHVSVPNHGKLWKSLMRAHLGDYDALEARLQRRVAGAATGNLAESNAITREI